MCSIMQRVIQLWFRWNLFFPVEWDRSDAWRLAAWADRGWGGVWPVGDGGMTIPPPCWGRGEFASQPPYLAASGEIRHRLILSPTRCEIANDSLSAKWIRPRECYWITTSSHRNKIIIKILASRKLGKVSLLASKHYLRKNASGE